MGFAGVAMFRASGNVVFAGEAQPADDVRERIESGSGAGARGPAAGVDRTAAEVDVIAAATPFETERLQSSAGKR